VIKMILNFGSSWWCRMIFGTISPEEPGKRVWRHMRHGD
jgi:hypothetical protein